jgi:hypothetical protein
MEKVGVEDLEKGDLIMVRWLDASDVSATLKEHEKAPETLCKDWGIYLGVSGRERRFIIIAKDVVVTQSEWGASRIPLELVEEIVRLMSRSQVMEAIGEVKRLGRRVRVRRYSRENAEYVRLASSSLD